MERKNYLFIVAFCLISFALIGCSKDVQTTMKMQSKVSYDNVAEVGFPIVKEPITIDIGYVPMSECAPWNDMKVFKEYGKVTNINANFLPMDAVAYREHRDIMFASNEYPDAFMRGEFTPDDETNYGEQGILTPLNDLIDKYAPNFKALMEKHPEIRKNITAPDGNIYTLPQIIDDSQYKINNMAWINVKWLDMLGLNVPTTTEEYYNALKAFEKLDHDKNAKNDNAALYEDVDLSILMYLRGSFGIGTAGAKQDKFDIDSNGKFRFIPVDDRYKEMLQYVARLYGEGLINKDVVTTDKSKFLINASKSGSFVYPNIDSIAFSSDQDQKEYVALPVLKGPHGDQIFSQLNPITTSQGTFAITNKNKHPEATMRWIDYFYSVDGSRLIRMGIEGKTYEYLNNGQCKYTDLILKDPKDKDKAFAEYMPWPGDDIPCVIYNYYDKGEVIPVEKRMGITYGDMQRAMFDGNISSYLPKETWPNFMFTKDESNQLHSMQTDIGEYVKQMATKFITGREPFSSWDKYKTTVEEMGLKEFIGIHQAAYERWKKK